jgi:hypothetical protein
MSKQKPSSKEALAECSPEAELEQLRRIAEDTFGVKFGKDKVVRSGSEANLVGIRTEHVLFSRRLDSRTYFVQDTRFGIGREAGVFHGVDKAHLKACRDILKRLKISTSEIANEMVVKEHLQAARVDHKTQTVHKEKVQEGKYFARLSRAVAKRPVWSSGMVLGLTKDQSVGYLQLHWPELPTHVLEEAHHLAYRVENQWHAPEQAGADVESIEAGVIHSPAMALLMDIYPAIRVIYRPKDARLGQKAVYFYDRHGKPVPIPRQADMPPETPLERHASKLV